VSSDSNFEEEIMYGYTQYTEYFDKWCKKALNILGNIIQCGIIELHSDGTAYIVANRPDIGEQNISKKYYEHETNWTFYKNPVNSIATHSTQFGHENSKVYTKDFRYSWFYNREVINKDIQRNYFFVSDSPIIYEKFMQNTMVAKRLLQFFKKESSQIINLQQEHKFNLAQRSTNYFSVENIDKTEREKFNELLHVMGVLDKSKSISKREWQCIKIVQQGKTASEAGAILGISRRTVESYFLSVKEKLNVHTRGELLDIITGDYK
jgi:DNA-binding CsgD family transcriptional regulator